MNIIKYETPTFELGFERMKPTIFLAGPTVRQKQARHLGLISWRLEAVEEFKKQGFDGTLIIPEFENWDNLGEHQWDIPEWEFTGLKYSDAILFWLPRTEELIGLTTNFELGYWLGRDQGKIIYGRPNNAYRISYPDKMWELEIEDSGVWAEPICRTLESTVERSIYLAKKRFNENTSV